MTNQATPYGMLWARDEWVPPKDRREQRLINIVAIASAITAVVLMFLSLFGSFTQNLYLALLPLLGIVSLMIPAIRVAAYRKCDSSLPASSRIFHLSRTQWQLGYQFNLDPTRDRPKHVFEERGRLRLRPATFFFPQRPTAGHAKAQKLSEEQGTPRFLYELRTIAPIETLYWRGPARAASTPIPVVVVGKQLVSGATHSE